MALTDRIRRGGAPVAVLFGVAFLVWVLATAALVGQPLPADDGADSIAQAIDAGRYDEAERIAADRVQDVDREFGTGSIQSARITDWWVRARLLNGRAAERTTLDAAGATKEIREREHLGDSSDIVMALENLADLRAARGEAATALPLLERAVGIRRRDGTANPGALADSLDKQANSLILLQRYGDAGRALDESRALRASVVESPLATARTLYLIALLHRYDGQYAAASDALDRVQSIRSQLLTGPHPAIHQARQLRGQLQFLRGDITGARETWQIALAEAEDALRPGHPDIAEILRYSALATRAIGDLPLARDLLDRALPIAEASLAPCNPELSGLWVDTATTMQLQGNYIPAQKLYATALATRERCFGPNDQRTATVVYNQADLANQMGDLQRADLLFQRAIRMWTAGLGADHPYVARGLDALALVAANRSQPARARQLYARALRSRQRSLGSEHPDVAWTLISMARLEADAGQARLATSYLNRGLAIYRASGAADEPDHLARSLLLQGQLALETGNFQQATASFDEALALRESIFGPAHPLVADARANLATLSLASGRRDEAIRSALSAESIGRDHLRFIVRYLPERQALEYANERPRGLDIALSALDSGSAEATPVLDAVIQSRGVVLDELAARTGASRGGDADVQALTASLSTLRARFANLILRTVEGESTPASLIENTQREKEAVERDLAERSLTVRAELGREKLGFDAIRRALPSNAALVSYVRYQRTTFSTTQGRTTRRSRPFYIAFVLKPGALDPVAVQLDAASLIDADTSAFHREAGQPPIQGASPVDAERAYRVIARRLRQRIWDPVAPQLANASLVLIVPDGALNLVNFAALPVDQIRYLVDTGPAIHLLTSERDLVVDQEATAGDGLLAVGGPSYDARLSATREDGRRGAGCTGSGPLQFDDLPGARAEADDVAALWRPGRGNGPASESDVTVLSGRTATKDAVQRAARGRRVLHLATHGFFLGAECAPSPPATRSVGELVPTIPLPTAHTAAHPTALIGNPLLAAGLAFAGANRRASDRSLEDAGILTAEEVASLDLHGVEWAVLSACDTGLGEIRAGEGVLGLRRAFQIAGVHTIIMSLWSVGDQSTRQWMRALYDERFQQGANTADAVRRASQKMLRLRRLAGQSTHPFYWAAFVAAGDWR